MMQCSGLARLEAAKQDGSWELFDDVEDLRLPTDLTAALAASPTAAAGFERFSPSARKQLLRTDARRRRAGDHASPARHVEDAVAMLHARGGDQPRRPLGEDGGNQLCFVHFGGSGGYFVTSRSSWSPPSHSPPPRSGRAARTDSRRHRQGRDRYRRHRRIRADSPPCWRRPAAPASTAPSAECSESRFPPRGRGSGNLSDSLPGRRPDSSQRRCRCSSSSAQADRCN